MKAPKILPWLASRAGVSESRGEVLWAEACQRAASITGERDTSFYWGSTQRILVNLLADERWRTCHPLAWPWLLMQRGLEAFSRGARRWPSPTHTAHAGLAPLALPWLPAGTYRSAETGKQ
ncbi:hypothetical protein ACCAA_660076 [Candidatus Accumulibacter aalborgensis]|uniref:Uncharacterized protein n=1 Tax=Candidatus Accumulibacter aalborgensis TaxID=1860102 RepID=A0A1A8XVI1_9PROT|nr:hypothetical protein [Candidatus Accumulibacter aalborgensis]SBT09035.1 hypothetical protein ACCAA_660076 [Candidatus Accumulibacter aalborgensis]